jgi:hypothetical protein
MRVGFFLRKRGEEAGSGVWNVEKIVFFPNGMITEGNDY